MAAKKKAGQTVVWVLMALLILGLGGFGVTNFSGNIRSIGAVGDKEISVDDYARALQEEIRAIEAQTGQALSFAQAEQLGVVDAALARLITERAFDHETARIGLSVGDKTLSEQLRSIPSFQGIDGNFDRDAYEFALDRAGISQATFEADLREDTARTLLQGAVVAGSGMPATYAETLVNYLGERRKVTWVRLDESALDAPVEMPTDAVLRAYYEANIDRYTSPERKQITYAWLTPDMLIDEIEIEADVLKSAYEDRRDEFERPERRLVERLIYPDAAAADAARARFDAGEADFDTLVDERGLDLSDIDMGDVTLDELGTAGDAVFAAESGDIVGPLDTDLGPALFRVNGILPAQTVEYRDAIEIIRNEMVGDRARRMVDQQIEPVEDLLAGGATLEDLAAETDMQLGTIDWFEGFNEDIAAYDGFDIAAAALAEGDYPELEQLEDGGIFAMRLEGTLPAAPTPFDEVKERVHANWETNETLTRLRNKAEVLRARLAESTSFEQLGLEVKVEEALPRSGSVLGTTQAFVTRVFEMEPGEIAVTEGFGTVQVLRLDEIIRPDAEDEQSNQLRNALESTVSQSLAQDLYNAYAQDIRQSAGVTLDREAMNAVHATFR